VQHIIYLKHNVQSDGPEAILNLIIVDEKQTHFY